MTFERREMEIHVKLHAEEGTLWAQVEEVPGCFAAGDTLEELAESLNEALALCLKDEPAKTISPSAFNFTTDESLILKA